MDLGIAEFCLPGGVREKLELVEQHGLWLELAHQGLPWKLAAWEEALKSFRVRVRSVQAFLQHELSLLSGSAVERRAAFDHVKQVIEWASGLSAHHVVVVPCYGEPGVENPEALVVETLKRLAKLAEDNGVVLGLEPLGRNKTTFLPGLRDVVDLARKVGSESVRPMADTMHIHDNGDPVQEVIAENLPILSEIQLRDTGSLPPGSGGIDFRPIVRMLREYRGLVCIEYKPGPNPLEDFEKAMRTVTGSEGVGISAGR